MDHGSPIVSGVNILIYGQIKGFDLQLPSSVIHFFQRIDCSLAGVLLSYISAGLGDSLTTQMETAWTKFLNTMVNVVEEEMEHLTKGI